MLISRVLEVQHGDTVEAIRRFLGRLLDERIVQGIFATVDLASGEDPHPQVVRDRAGLALVNPLLPVLLENGAKKLQRAVVENPGVKIAVVMRPCEIRAVIELAKRHRFERRLPLMIGVDCLGTYDPGFYRDVNGNHPDEPYYLLHESLRFAPRGQIAPYRYRAACQLCDRPTPDYKTVDILLGLIGVKAREKVLVLADEDVDTKLRLERVTDRKSTEREAVEREVAVWQLANQRRKAAARRVHQLGIEDADITAIKGYLNKCNLCGDCITVCPLQYNGVRAALQQGKAAFVTAFTSQTDRLASCAACGMCQEYCPEHIPLAAINYVLSEQVRQPFGYVQGRDRRERLPRTLAVSDTHS